MVKFFFNLIKSGKIKIEDVPVKWRSKVEELLNK